MTEDRARASGCSRPGSSCIIAFVAPSDRCDLEPCKHGVPYNRVCIDCPDPCVVDSGPVAIIIAAYVSRWRVERPSLKGRYASPDSDDDTEAGAVEPYAPYTFLAVDSGIADMHARRAGRVIADPHTGRQLPVPNDLDVAAAERDIRRARNTARNPTVELRIADALVASIGEPGMFYGDTPQLVPRPNPRAPASRHGECCGGSLTGSGS